MDPLPHETRTNNKTLTPSHKITNYKSYQFHRQRSFATGKYANVVYSKQNAMAKEKNVFTRDSLIRYPKEQCHTAKC